MAMKKVVNTKKEIKVFIGLFLILLICFMGAGFAYALDPDKTPENVQKKAVIVTHDAKLFKKASGSEGEEASFMRIYFLMKPKIRNRVPVSRYSGKTGQPDGWLEKKSFIEWNTLQMIKIEPQSGRKLAKIFGNLQCAELFGKSGQDPSGCNVIGQEPNRIYKTKEEYQLLIPVFDKGKDNYQGGFIRVYQKGLSVKPSKKTYNVPTKISKGTLGYDIVFAVDKTASMGKWFKPTTEVLQSFIKLIEDKVKGGEVPLPFRIGLLFYKDRLTSEKCNEEFLLAEWGKEITQNVDSVIQVLKTAKEATCSSEEVPEAVLDGLNRIIIDTKWADNHFRAVVLVGDAGIHPKSNQQKNPMGLDVSYILNKAQEKGIRFLTFKIGSDDNSFMDLANKPEPRNKGRYKSISTGGGIQEFKNRLLEAMMEEWGLLTKAQTIFTAGIGSQDIAPSTGINDSILGKYNIKPYEALIIAARLPPKADPSTANTPHFVKGWIPQKIEKQLVVSEYIFMGKARLKILINTLENIAEGALIGQEEGGEAFISIIRNSLATQLKTPANQLFGSGETLNSMLEKGNILPFKTQTLSFTADEVNNWKPDDYKRINQILREKVNYLREFVSKPGNIRDFGGRFHYYVPRVFFP
jgi:hypothetical protein